MALLFWEGFNQFVLLVRVSVFFFFTQGDPCSAHDLVRVAAYDALSICVMLTDRGAKV